MVMKKWVLFLLFPLLVSPAAAREEGQVYIIRKGDTLWGISERFLNDPHYWPNLWSHNPEIANPHFIYPGNRVRLYGGRLILEPVTPEAAAAEPETATPPSAETLAATPAPAEVQEVRTIRLPAKVEGFIAAGDLAAAGSVVDAVDGRLMLATDDTVFVDMTELASVRPGDRYTVLRVGAEVLHPATGERVGFRVLDLGTLSIAAVHQKVATGVITSATREIGRGDRLVSWQAPVREIALKQARAPLAGYVVDGGGGQTALGQHDLIYVDLGTADGLETGNVLYVGRPRRTTDLAEGKDLELPDMFLGSAVVVDARQETAAALILKSTQPILHGDRVTAAIE